MNRNPSSFNVKKGFYYFTQTQPLLIAIIELFGAQNLNK